MNFRCDYRRGCVQINTSSVSIIPDRDLPLPAGLRSYGKVVYVFSVVPVFGMLVLCTKMLGLMPRDSHHQVFPETEWTEFFTNSAVSLLSRPQLISNSFFRSKSGVCA